MLTRHITPDLQSRSDPQGRDVLATIHSVPSSNSALLEALGLAGRRSDSPTRTLEELLDEVTTPYLSATELRDLVNSVGMSDEEVADGLGSVAGPSSFALLRVLSVLVLSAPRMFALAVDLELGVLDTPEWRSVEATLATLTAADVQALRTLATTGDRLRSLALVQQHLPIAVQNEVLTATDTDPLAHSFQLDGDQTPWYADAPEGSALFRDGEGDGQPIAFTDVRQGMAGDCWFLGTLAALAGSRPELVRDMIDDSGAALGQYLVRFFLPDRQSEGERAAVWVRVDDDMPVLDGRLQYAGYSQFDATWELWPLLVEKAYARLESSYKAAEGGDASSALAMFLPPGEVGQSVEWEDRGDPSTEEALWSALSSGHGPITASFQVPGGSGHLIAVVGVDGDGPDTGSVTVYDQAGILVDLARSGPYADEGWIAEPPGRVTLPFASFVETFHRVSYAEADAR